MIDVFSKVSGSGNGAYSDDGNNDDKNNHSNNNTHNHVSMFSPIE